MEHFEWENEPNRIEFTYIGFNCLILRHLESRHLCGYVALLPDHPYYGKDYNDIDVDVHGGLTFATEGRDEWESGYWWIGFDCAHGGDYSPRIGKILDRGPRQNEIYRNVEYVTKELQRLCEQLTPEGILQSELEG